MRFTYIERKITDLSLENQRNFKEAISITITFVDLDLFMIQIEGRRWGSQKNSIHPNIHIRKTRALFPHNANLHPSDVYVTRFSADI